MKRIMCAAVTVAIAVLFVAAVSAQAPNDYGACANDINRLLAAGGAISKVRRTRSDFKAARMTFYYDEGSSWTELPIEGFLKEPKSPEAKRKAQAERIEKMRRRERAAQNGEMWYMVVKRAAFSSDIPAELVNPSNPKEVWRWKPIIVYTVDGICNLHSIDVAIVPHNVPAKLRMQLRE